MSKPEFFVTPGYGEKALDLLYYSQAVRVDNREPGESFEHHGDPKARQRHLPFGVDDRMTGAERLARMILTGKFDNNPGRLASREREHRPRGLPLPH